MIKLVNKSVGLLGGSFDPAHKGHLTISKIAIKKIRLHKLLWIVTRKIPFKTNPFYSISQRLRFAKEITKNIKKIEVHHLDETVKSTRTINTIDYLIKKKKLSTYI